MREFASSKLNLMLLFEHFELFVAVVARLVPKAEVAKTPKAQAALDKELENL